MNKHANSFLSVRDRHKRGKSRLITTERTFGERKKKAGINMEERRSKEEECHVKRGTARETVFNYKNLLSTLEKLSKHKMKLVLQLAKPLKKKLLIKRTQLTLVTFCIKKAYHQLL